ncbi:YetF domain-containing protein [Priestia megaterium]|uniref:YetF domain-containing protein n=1 Tax=Priestia megaterium TaxID=1404 RepID=UPI002E205FF9
MESYVYKQLHPGYSCCNVLEGEESYKRKKDLFPLATEVIVDGIINTDNLSKLNLDRKWLYEKLQELDVKSISEVFYGEVQRNGQLFIDTKNDISH